MAMRLTVVNFSFNNDNDMAISATFRDQELVDGKWLNNGDPEYVNDYQINDAGDTTWHYGNQQYRLALSPEDYDWLAENYEALTHATKGWTAMQGDSNREFLQITERRLVNTDGRCWALCCQAIRQSGKIYPGFFANLRASNIAPVKGGLKKRH